MSVELDLGGLHFPQARALASPAAEVLYGGAAGGGKSHVIRVAAITWAHQVPGLNVFLFRRTYPELMQNHMEGPQGFRNMLAPWLQSGFARIQGEKNIRFANGSSIFLRHCQREADLEIYQGSEIHVLLIDELTHFTDTIYRFLRHRVRLAGLKLPGEYEGKFPRILCGSNPGSVGHHWVKQAWVDEDPLEDGHTWKAPKSEGGMVRQYIPAQLEDNPSLTESDPEYENRLEGLGDPALIRALRRGDWDIVIGAYFGDLWTRERRARIIRRDFPIPPSWRRFRAFDWGSSKPFSLGFYAESDGTPAMLEGYTFHFPRGSIFRYAEWYGAKRDANGKTIPNDGLQMTNEEIGAGIVALSRGEKFNGCVADPSIWAELGGPSIYAQMRKGARRAKGSLKFSPADNTRVAGWQKMRSLLKFAGNEPPIEDPGLFIFSRCSEWIRTVPVLNRHVRKIDDLDTDEEDHVADECRYAVMSRKKKAGKMKVRLGGN